MHGYIHDTFQETRLAMEVLEDDKKMVWMFKKNFIFSNIITTITFVSSIARILHSKST
jgi:hypothetical protein